LAESGSLRKGPALQIVNWPAVKNHHRTGLPEPGSAGRTSCAVRVLLLGSYCSFSPANELRQEVVSRWLSSDLGRTWTDPFLLRGDGGSQDIGYLRSVVQSDGKIVTVYAFHDRAGSACDIETTVWDPGSRWGRPDCRVAPAPYPWTRTNLKPLLQFHFRRLRILFVPSGGDGVA
jgi:hypothetical protein